MVTHVFDCDACGATFEERAPINAVPQTAKCPKCQGGSAKRRECLGGQRGMVTPDWQAYASSRLPKNPAGVKCDGNGRPILTSRQQEDRVLKTLGYERE